MMKLCLGLLLCILSRSEGRDIWLGSISITAYPVFTKHYHNLTYLSVWSTIMRCGARAYTITYIAGPISITAKSQYLQASS